MTFAYNENMLYSSDGRKIRYTRIANIAMMNQSWMKHGFEEVNMLKIRFALGQEGSVEGDAPDWRTGRGACVRFLVLPSELSLFVRSLLRTPFTILYPSNQLKVGCSQGGKERGGCCWPSMSIYIAWSWIKLKWKVPRGPPTTMGCKNCVKVRACFVQRIWAFAWLS